MKAPLISAARLAAFAGAVLIAVTAVHLLAKNTIAERQTAALLQQFQDIAPQLPLDGDFLAQKTPITLFGRTGYLYRAPDGSAFIQTTTGKGYNGDIELLIGIEPDGQTLRGVRVLSHKETPGLGDKIDTRISPWILQFQGKTLANSHFAVKKDGGDFDSFTGATITPRAVVNQIGAALAEAPEILKMTPKKARE